MLAPSCCITECVCPAVGDVKIDTWVKVVMVSSLQYKLTLLPLQPASEP